MQQHYNNYTNEDREVWKLLFERQMPNIEQLASLEYINGLSNIGFKSDKIPNFEESNLILGRQTGWSLEVVPGIIPVKEFFELLAVKRFSATTWLRKLEQLDYLEEPDMFHDVFGHVPLLTNSLFCDFFQGLAKIGLKHVDNPLILEMLGKIYWFTVEFGLIQEKNQLKIYGAGILSSPGETQFCMTNKCERIPFDIKSIIQTNYRTDVYQEKYFVIQSFEQLFNCLENLEEIMAEEEARMLKLV